MATRIKTYNKTAAKYAKMLQDRGYTVRFNWDGISSEYTDITIVGHGEFSTPKEAWKALVTKKM